MPDLLNISTTRSELQARKKQIELTLQGYNLLDKKRMALLQELIRLEERVVNQAENLHESTAHAHQALAFSIAKLGRNVLRSASTGNHNEVKIETDTRSVMGVKLPHIKSYNLDDSLQGSFTGFIDQSMTLDDVSAAFKAEVIAILHLAEGEMQFTRLLEEIQNVTRRLKAIELILIPRLQAEYRYIRMALDERERSDHNRLKIAKEKLNTKHFL
jgi:V/A-type H+-transporting ATPase subunit D